MHTAVPKSRMYNVPTKIRQESELYYECGNACQVFLSKGSALLHLYDLMRSWSQPCYSYACSGLAYSPGYVDVIDRDVEQLLTS